MTPLEWVKNIISVCAAGIDRENEQRTQDDARNWQKYTKIII